MTTADLLLKNGKIIDPNRIDKVMPTLEFLLKKKAKIIIISHVGRPKGKIVKELSLELISLYIKSKIKKEVSLLKENIFNLNKEEIFKNTNVKTMTRAEMFKTVSKGIGRSPTLPIP